MKKVDYMTEYINYIGWHGTNEANKMAILSDGFHVEPFNFSKGKFPNDLGQGAYFFADFNGEPGSKMAKRYIKHYKRGNKLIKVLITSEEDAVLDLDDSDTIDYLKDFYTQYEQAFDECCNQIVAAYKRTHKGKKFRILDRGNFDGILIEMLIEELKKRDKEIEIVLKQTFLIVNMGNFVRKMSMIPNCQEICVRNIDTIQILEEQ